jgi:hypothetical protein
VLFYAGSDTYGTGDPVDFPACTNNMLPLTFFGACTTQNQWYTWTNPGAVVGNGIANIYYIAFFYDAPGNGSLNFKAKNCTYGQSCAPLNGAISGPNPVCPGSTSTYTAPAAPSGSTYAWSVTGSGSGSSNGSSIDVTAGSTCNGTYTVYLTITNGACTHQFESEVSVIDNTAPTIGTEASDETVECGPGNAAALTAWLTNNGGASATDGCSGVTWTNNFTGLSDLCGTIGAATVTFTAKDACTNASTTTATFTIEDTRAPTLTGTLPGGMDLNLCFSDVPMPTEASIAALYSDDCGGVTAALLSSNVTGDDCSWSATYTYGIKDDCYNAAADAVVTYTGGDTQGPTCPATPASFGMMTCMNSIPCPSVALAWMQANISDNCTSQSSITLSQTGDTGLPTCSNGIFSRTYTYLATDACGNTSSCSVTYSGNCQTLCTFPQGGWGQAGGAPGTVFGTTDLVLIGNLITANGGVLQIGTPTNGKYLNIYTATCVQTLLPGGGPAAALKVSGGSGCFYNQPSKNGKLNNVLASQTIALTLNTWLSGSTYQPGKNLGAESLDCIPGIPADVLAKLGANKTVADLLALTNKFLGGENTSPVGASSLNTAVTIINERWDNCVQPTATCSNAAPMMLSIGNLGNPTFHAWGQGHKVNLRWFVRNSEEVDHFVVKRSTDLIDYQKVATIMPGTDNNVEGYLALDEHPEKGYSYYQLTIFMKNGEVETLPEVEVFFPKSKPYKLMPNPASTETWIDLTQLDYQKDISIGFWSGCFHQTV